VNLLFKTLNLQTEYIQIKISFDLFGGSKFLFYLCKLNGERPESAPKHPLRTMKDRIRLIMESQHMTQKTFANFIGMSEGSLSSVFNGRTRPTLNIVEAIKNKIPAINTDWLMFGRGQMYADGNDAADVQQPGGNVVRKEPEIEFSGTDAVPQPTSKQQLISQGVIVTPNNSAKQDLNFFDKHQRKITEIRVFYDDQTWESFVPKK